MEGVVSKYRYVVSKLSAEYFIKGLSTVHLRIFYPTIEFHDCWIKTSWLRDYLPPQPYLLPKDSPFFFIIVDPLPTSPKPDIPSKARYFDPARHDTYRALAQAATPAHRVARPDMGLAGRPVQGPQIPTII